jgi:cullin-associated NEDD8-dissociated protein 1
LQLVCILHFYSCPSVHLTKRSFYTTRQVHYEIQAALDHLFFHPNTAPFLALRFIQRFGVSNPSPGYIARIAKSFSSGTHLFSESSSEPIVFGSGDYGDLSAMIASILLDRESRSVLLDEDPFHGSFREPLIKVISLMRNLEYKSNEKFVSFRRMKNLIGQMVS